MSEVRHNNSDRPVVPTAGDQTSAAHAEVQDFFRQGGRLSPSQVSDTAVHNMFGTPSFDFGTSGESSTQHAAHAGSQNSERTHFSATGQPLPESTSGHPATDGSSSRPAPESTSGSPAAGSTSGHPAAESTSGHPATSGSGTTAGGETHSHPSLGTRATDLATGALDFAWQGLRGAGQSVGALGHEIGEAGAAVGHAAVNAYHAAPGALASARDGVAEAAVDLATHPLQTLSRAEAAVEHTGTAVGRAVVDGVATTAQAAWDHPLQTAAIAGAAALEVGSLGTATPLAAALAVAGGVGTGFAVHDVWAAGAAVTRDAGTIAPMFHSSEATPEQLQAARATVARDTGTAVASVAALGTGYLVGRLAIHAEEASRAAAGTAGTAPAEDVGRAAAGTAGAAPAEDVGRAAAGTAGAARAQEVGQTAAGVVPPTPDFLGVASRAAEFAQNGYDQSSTTSNLAHLANVGGNGGPHVSAAEERARHSQTPAPLPEPVLTPLDAVPAT